MPVPRPRVIAIVTVQVILISFVVLVPWLEGNFPSEITLSFATIAAILLILLGVALGEQAVHAMGRSLTVSPNPRATGRLVTDWPFNFVRNPIYVAVILMGLGWALLNRSAMAAAGAIALHALFYVKATWEERALREKFGAEYEAYTKKVGRFVPKF